MIITEVTVSVHEKRNHPHEYGHYDAEVRLTAQLSPDDHDDVVTSDLLAKAAAHVKAECDRFIEQVEQERRAAFAAYQRTIGSESQAILDEADDEIGDHNVFA